MSLTTRWFLTDVRTKRVITFDGHPKNHPDVEYLGFERKYRPDGRVKKEQRMFIYKDRKYVGQELTAAQVDTIKCNRNCETARGPECKCQCGGKNHGISHRIEEKEIA